MNFEENEIVFKYSGPICYRTDPNLTCCRIGTQTTSVPCSEDDIDPLAFGGKISTYTIYCFVCFDFK